MKVALLHHNPGGYVGGAELTMNEFADAAPEGVGVIRSESGIPDDVDRYLFGNWFGSRPPGFRYVHDMRGGFRDDDRLIFCSPLQQEKYGLEGEVIPPALDLKRFKAPRQSRRHRKGNVAIAAWQNPLKGQQGLADWAEKNGEAVDVYGPGQFAPRGGPITYKGEVTPEQMPQTLWKYERFIHLPEVIEPFGRCVAEAWAAGLNLVHNENVGAVWFFKNDPDALQNAAQRLWDTVTT